MIRTKAVFAGAELLLLLSMIVGILILDQHQLLLRPLIRTILNRPVRQRLNRSQKHGLFGLRLIKSWQILILKEPLFVVLGVHLGGLELKRLKRRPHLIIRRITAHYLWLKVLPHGVPVAIIILAAFILCPFQLLLFFLNKRHIGHAIRGLTQRTKLKTLILHACTLLKVQIDHLMVLPLDLAGAQWPGGKCRDLGKLFEGYGVVLVEIDTFEWEVWLDTLNFMEAQRHSLMLQQVGSIECDVYEASLLSVGLGELAGLELARVYH